MPSFLEREQLLPVQPSIAPADQILGAFNTRQSLFGIGASQVKQASSSYNQMQVTNPQNQQQLDTLLKQSNQDLKSASMKDLSVGDNQTQALSVFDPILKDQDIMGDHALTQSWGASRQKAESDRVSNGGKNYNSASLDAVNYQQSLFAKADKSAWRQFYNNKETYSPYYNTQDELQKISKGFKTDVIEKDQQNGAYITTTKDSSWYKDKWQQYFEVNASPQLKAQLAVQSRAEYYRDMLTMPKEAIVQKYTDMRNNLIDKQMYVDRQNMMNIAASLAIKHDSKDNSPVRSNLLAQANYLDKKYSDLKTRRDAPLENGDALGDVNSLSIGTRVAEGLGEYTAYDKIGDAFAHEDKKMSIKPDYAYLSLAKIKEESREFGIRQAETGRHNRATEGIEGLNAQAHLMTAQAAMLSAEKKKDSDSEDTTDGMTNGSTTGGGGAGGMMPSSKVAGGDTTDTQKQGQTILDNLGKVQDKYNNTFDKMSEVVFSPNIWSTMKGYLNDPTKQNLTLSDIPDPTRAPDGSGGNASRIVKFMVAAGALTDSSGGLMDAIGARMGSPAYDPTNEAMTMPLSQVQETLRKIWSDPAMFKKGIEAIKGNDPNLSSYGIAAELEKQKQRIDGEHADIVNQAIPILRTNLGPQAALFEKDYFSRGRIPTKDEVRKVLNDVPLSAIKDFTNYQSDVPFSSKLATGLMFNTSDDAYRIAATNKITKDILGTLGNNRTAYNTQVENFFPVKGNAGSDNKFKNNVLTLIEGAEQATKGTGGADVSRVLEYAKNYPSLIDHVAINSVDEAHDLPTFQIYFKKASTAQEKADPPPPSGVAISTTNANDKFRTVPLDDRTLLLNNKALKFSSDYADGSKTNLSIYNSTGDKTNPQFDINPDFSYKSLDIDPKTGDIRGVTTIYRADEVNNLTQGRPQLLPLALSVDPSGVYNTLSNKIIKNRDAVNEYLKSSGMIKNINDLPQYLKTALQTNSF